MRTPGKFDWKGRWIKPTHTSFCAVFRLFAIGGDSTQSGRSGCMPHVLVTRAEAARRCELCYHVRCGRSLLQRPRSQLHVQQPQLHLGIPPSNIRTCIGRISSTEHQDPSYSFSSRKLPAQRRHRLSHPGPQNPSSRNGAVIRDETALVIVPVLDTACQRSATTGSIRRH